MKMLSLHRLLRLQILISCICTSMTLPVTSKPIENTPENLAWEEWIRRPGSATQEKTRKVSPKSIFILPQKMKNQSGDYSSGFESAAQMQCPPGQKAYDGKCIATVEIDRDKLLINQLTNLLHFGEKQHAQTVPIPLPNYEYDYDYPEEESFSPDVIDLDRVVEPVSVVHQKASPEEPLKVQIFLDKFAPPNGGETLEQAESSNKQFWQTVNLTAFGLPGTTTTTTTARSAPAPTEATQSEANVTIAPLDADSDDGRMQVVEETPAESTTVNLAEVLEDESLLLDRIRTTTDLVEQPTTEESATDQTTLAEEEEEEAVITTAIPLGTTTLTMEQEEDRDGAEPTTEEEDLTTTTTTTEMPIQTSTNEDEESQDAKTEPPPLTFDLTDEHLLDPTLASMASDKRYVYHHMSTSEGGDAGDHIVPTNRRKVVYVTTTTTERTPPIPLLFKPIGDGASPTVVSSSSPSDVTTETTVGDASDDDDTDAEASTLWWLPSGWTVDKTGEKPLLLRFWSKVPGL